MWVKGRAPSFHASWWHNVSALLQASMQASNSSESINVHEWVIDRHDIDFARVLEVGAVDVARDVGR